MLKNLIKKGKGNKGFTLIELIVVIAIIAILALILVPRFAGFTTSAADRTNAGNRRTIETAVNVLYADGRLTGTGEFTVSANTVVAVTDTDTLAYSPMPAGVSTLAGAIQSGLVGLVGSNLEPAGTVTSYTVEITSAGVDVS